MRFLLCIQFFYRYSGVVTGVIDDRHRETGIKPTSAVF